MKEILKNNTKNMSNLYGCGSESNMFSSILINSFPKLFASSFVVKKLKHCCVFKNLIVTVQP